MRVRNFVCFAIFGLALPLATGCATARVRVEITSQYKLTAQDTTAKESGEEVFRVSEVSLLEVRSRNGRIEYYADPHATDFSITAEKSARGYTLQDAQEALSAIEVYVEDKGDGISHLAWRWAGAREFQWRGSVAFKITGPSTINLDAKSHNGRIKVTDLAGDLVAVSHNGRLELTTSGKVLYAETHNGRIELVSSAKTIEATSHNGRIIADLTATTVPDAVLETHNGRVEVQLAQNASAKINLRTGNGSVNCKHSLKIAEVTRSRIQGTLGHGDGRVKIHTNNGSIFIQ